jgi:hypothetical protein
MKVVFIFVTQRSFMFKKGKAGLVKHKWHVVFFDSERILYKELIPQGQSVNQQLQIGTLRHWKSVGRVSGENT